MLSLLIRVRKLNYYYLERETEDPETNWNEILNFCWHQENDSCHTFHIVEIEASHDSQLLKFDGVEVEYPDYKELDKALSFYTEEEAYLILILYQMEIAEHEHRPKRVRIVGFDRSGCLIFPKK